MTPVYNRRGTIQRTINSVQAQTFRDIEYIIVDDGSDESQRIDDIVDEFMNNTDIPVMFIRKPNGGVHTARNRAVKEARGKFLLGIDSDDELVPKTCETFIKAWESIPEGERHKYRGVIANHMDQNGELLGTSFPESPLSSTGEEIRNKYHVKGDKISLTLMSIRKENLFPEPEGVNFVMEGIMWARLDQKYLTWCINDILGKVHTEGNDHLSGGGRKGSMTFQRCKDWVYNIATMANKLEIYHMSLRNYMKRILCYCILENIVKKKEPEFVKRYPLKGIKNKFWKAVMFIPAKIATPIYIRKRMP